MRLAQRTVEDRDSATSAARLVPSLTPPLLRIADRSGPVKL